MWLSETRSTFLISCGLWLRSPKLASMRAQGEVQVLISEREDDILCSSSLFSSPFNPLSASSTSSTIPTIQRWTLKWRLSILRMRKSRERRCCNEWIHLHPIHPLWLLLLLLLPHAIHQRGRRVNSIIIQSKIKQNQVQWHWRACKAARERKKATVSTAGSKCRWKQIS